MQPRVANSRRLGGRGRCSHLTWRRTAGAGVGAYYPGTLIHLERAKEEKVSPARVPLSLCPRWQPAAGARGPAGRARRLGGTGLCLLLPGAERPREPFSSSGLEDPGSLRPLPLSLILEASCLRPSLAGPSRDRREPRGAAHPPSSSSEDKCALPVWDVGAFGDTGPQVTLRPRRGCNKRPFVVAVIFSGALMALEATGDPGGD